MNETPQLLLGIERFLAATLSVFSCLWPVATHPGKL